MLRRALTLETVKAAEGTNKGCVETAVLRTTVTPETAVLRRRVTPKTAVLRRIVTPDCSAT